MQDMILSNPDLLREHSSEIRQLLLKEILLGQAKPSIIPLLLDEQPMQVILCAAFDLTSPLEISDFHHQIEAAGLDSDSVELVSAEDFCIILLKGSHIIRRFRDFSDQRLQDDPNISWIHPCPDHLFLACGTEVDTPMQLSQSYQHATLLLQQRFFCQPQQHILLPEQLQARGTTPALTMLLLENYTDRLVQYVQTFNRFLTAQALQDLKQTILTGNDSANAIRLFFADLYLQIKEQMKNLYQGYTIPFYSNTHIIRSIFQMKCLDEIILFLSQRFDMIMSAIGASSRESVLDDILHYIRHNYNTNITLEKIAPLFGYNHSYLGKIFRKKMGVSFNEYVDRLRIERAKELLLTDNAMVYVISERVGYKNVDYFHVKFRKYEKVSPAEYRKAHKIVSNSPDRENWEKGPLF